MRVYYHNVYVFTSGLIGHVSDIHIDLISKLLYNLLIKIRKGDLAVMSIEAYEQLVGRFEFYSLVIEGLKDVDEGKTKLLADAMSEIRASRNK